MQHLRRCYRSLGGVGATGMFLFLGSCLAFCVTLSTLRPLPQVVKVPQNPPTGETHQLIEPINLPTMTPDCPRNYKPTNPVNHKATYKLHSPARASAPSSFTHFHPFGNCFICCSSFIVLFFVRHLRRCYRSLCRAASVLHLFFSFWVVAQAFRVTLGTLRPVPQVGVP